MVYDLGFTAWGLGLQVAANHVYGLEVYCTTAFVNGFAVQHGCEGMDRASGVRRGN